MISSKDAKEVGITEHHTHKGICVAFHMRLSVEMKGRVTVTQSSNAAGKTKKNEECQQIQKQRDEGYKRINKFNSNKAEQQQQRNIAAREAALEHLSIKQQYGYADHARIYDFAERVEDAPIHTIDASIAFAPITGTDFARAACRMSSTPACLVELIHEQLRHGRPPGRMPAMTRRPVMGGVALSSPPQLFL